MATDSGAADGGPGSLNLTAEEKRVFGQLFRQADTEGIGVVTGEVAVKFFEKTKLEPWILGEIWQIADKENRGLLTPAGFGIVLRLIGHYQAGQNPTPELAFKPGPLPRFEGITIAGTIPPPPPGPPPGALRPPPGTLRPQASGGPIRVPPLTPEKVNQYAVLFEKSGAQGGVLAGEQAKQIFEKAGLPNEILGRIWNLADTEQRGALVLPEFIIAMHLIASFKSGTMQVLPSILPAGLYEAATRRVPIRQLSGAPPGTPPISAIGKQPSGASAGRTGSPLGRPAYSAPSQPVMTAQANDWAITPVEKAQFDSLYATLDKTNRGFITGDEAVPFFSNSKLPEEVLASIWDLADIQSQGRLTRDEFAVAMYLIRQQRSKRDGRDTLPATLPANLIPPSMRNNILPAAQGSAAVFDPPAPVIPKSAADDLFGLDALSTAPSAPTQAPMSTGGSTGFGDPFGNTRTPLTPTSPTQGSSSLQSSTSFKPFVPSSSFGQTLTQNATGGSTNSGPVPQSKSAPSAVDDLLGDNDPEVSKKLTSETTELANLSNHVGTLSKKMQEVQAQRSTSQNELNQASTQKREFELRLSQLRALYEQEVKDVKSLQERLTASRNETKKLQQDIAMIEGTYLDLQNQHRQIVTALQADQQENTSLKERMRVVNAEISEMKPQLEKLRSEARQQKGLVAINKKQLATNEGERDKLKVEADELMRSNEQARAIAVSSQAQSPAAVTSPALSTMSGNNPFFRRQTSISSDGASAPLARSPPATQQSDRSFDNIFGPTFPSSTAPERTIPPTTFNQEVEASHNIPSPAVKMSLPMHPSEAGELAAPPISQPNLSPREVSEQIEAPAPPESRQTSSSFLPFSPERMDSLSSSRQVSAPTSRYGESSTTGPDTPTSYTGTTPTGLPAAGQTETAAGVSPHLDRNASASPVVSEARSITNVHGSVPGAFPVDPSSHITATSTGGSTFSDSKEPFPLSKDPPRTPTGAKDDFDAAFAGFGGSGVAKDRQASSSSNDSAVKTTGAFNKEFPPLKELEQDDDSEDSDEHGGFEDDFTSVTPSHSRKETSMQGQSSPPPTIVANDGANSPSQSRPTVLHSTSAMSMGGDPPIATAQSSPPAYDKAVSPQDKAHAEVDQYSGLLPAREDPTLSPHPHTREQAFSSPAVTGGQALFGNAPNITSTLPPPPAKVPFDDFDNDFDDLEEAKEGDIDDDFAHISALDRSGTLDFDPTFDSPAASKTSQHTAQGSSGFGVDSNSFGDFTQSPGKSTAAQPAPLSTGMSTADSNDWDAIFAGLDQPSTTSGAFEVKNTVPAKTNGAGTTAAAVRPAFGRALTEAGEHDDPILKDLTAMGYARKDALSALEKYDYNLERAANYLASQ